MHSSFSKADALSHDAIGAAIEVHRDKGPGLIESIYDKCLGHELKLRKIGFTQQRAVRVEHKGFAFDEPLRFDLPIEDCLLLELKCVEKVLPIHQVQLLSYHKVVECAAGFVNQLSRRTTGGWCQSNDVAGG